MNHQLANDEQRRSVDRIRFNRRTYKLLLLAGVLLIAAWLGWKAWRVTRAALSLRQHQQTAESLMADGPMSVDPNRAEELVYAVRADVVVLHDELRPFLPLTRLFTWLPKVGPLFREAEPLLVMADAGSEAAAYAVRGLKPALALMQSGRGGEELLPQMLPILEAAEPDLRAAEGALQRVIAARNDISNTDDLPWRIQTLLGQIDDKLYLAEELRLLPVLPEVLGAEGRRTYLIVAQNEDELRATGGFITGAGLLTVDEGRIIDLAFQDANLIDDWRNKPYDFPPQPLYELMGLELFLFRDANFWPHFPTSARRAMELYRYGQDSPALDGVIAINQEFVSRLVAVTGPVTINDLEMTVTSQNAIASLRDAWAIDDQESVQEWVPTRKDFMGPFAQALKQQLFSNLGSIDLLFLAQTMYEAAQEKHLQVYVRDERVARVLDELDWDGRLEVPASADLVMAVDTNVGYNKVNARTRRSIMYDVQLNDDGTAAAQLSLQYEHTGQPGTLEECSQQFDYHAGMRYEALMQRCFWNYLRVYVPVGSVFQEASTHTLDGNLFKLSEGWQREPGLIKDSDQHTAIENFFLLRPGETIESNYEYQLPLVVSENDGLRQYELHLLKQSGQAEEPVEVRITLPTGSSLVSATPEATVENRTIVFRTTLTSDRIFTVSYR